MEENGNAAPDGDGLDPRKRKPRVPETIDGESGKIIPPKPQLRIAPLNDMRSVKREKARIYRATRKGEMSTKDGLRLINMLSSLEASIERTDFQAQLKELEAHIMAALPRAALP